jgi:hypothetical protein
MINSWMMIIVLLLVGSKTAGKAVQIRFSPVSIDCCGAFYRIDGGD